MLVKVQKKIQEALEALFIDPFSINGILITHEHSDHTKGLGIFSKKFNIPVYANKETWDAMPTQMGKIDKENIKYFTFESFSLGDIEVRPFPIPHDAANPCGFNIYYDSKKMSIATDIGHIDNNVMNNLSNSCFMLLEANYEPEVLKCSRYPYLLKTRISGPNGHLSNNQAGQAISYLAKHGLNSVMLGHLSNENNFPELAYKTVVDELIENKVENDNFQVFIANRNKTSKIIDI